MGTLETESDWSQKEHVKESRHDQQDMSAKKSSNKGNSIIAGDKRIRTKYYFYAGMLFIFMIILVALVVVSDIIPKESTLSVLRKQVRFSFSQQLRLHATMITAISFDLVSASGVSYNHNKPITQQIPIALQDFIDLKNQIITIFRESDGGYDPEIEDILFGDGCATLTGTRRTNCDSLTQASIPTNLINLLNLLEAAAIQKVERYYTSDGSSASQRAIESLDFGKIYTILIVVIAQFDYISTDLEQTFQRDLDDSANERDVILGIDIAILIVFCVLIWACLLRQFKEINNQLKTVLRVFPSNLVLYNFILKMFLVETSKGTLKYNQVDV